MPAHNHNILKQQQYSVEDGELEGENSIYGETSTITDAYIDSNDIYITGGSQPHNNMPPYLAVYMWKRIS